MPFHTADTRGNPPIELTLVTYNVNAAMSSVTDVSLPTSKGAPGGRIIENLRSARWDVLMLSSTGKISPAGEDMLQNALTAEVFYSNHPATCGAGTKAGVAIIVRRSLLADARWAITGPPLIHIPGRAMELTLSQSDGPDLRLLVVYAPNTDHAGFYQQLATNSTRPLLTGASPHLVVGGDFNNVLSQRDYAGAAPAAQWAKSEGRHQLRNWLATEALSDCYRQIHATTTGGTFSTWSTAGYCTRRLDRFYSTPDCLSSVTNCRTRPWTGSDHLPLFLTMGAQNRRRHAQPGRAKLPAFLAGDKKFLASVDAFLSTAWDPRCPDAVLNYSSIMADVHRLGMARAADIRRKHGACIRTLQMRLDDLNTHLAASPTDEDLWQRRIALVSQLQTEMTRLHLTKPVFLRKKCRWYAGSSRAAARIHPSRNCTLPPRMAAFHGGVKSSDADGLRRNCEQYLASIFQRTTTNDEAEEAAEEFCQLVRDECKRKGTGLTDTERTELGKHITPHEIQTAARGRADTCAGLDGHPFWLYAVSEKAAAALADVVNAARDEGCLPYSMRASKVVLLYKGHGPQDLLTNYRALTIASTAYRLFSRVLANRLNVVIGKLIGGDQTAFVPGRLIQTNFLLVDYAQFRCQRDQQPGVCLSVDVAKAFDSCSFTYLEKILKAWGLGEGFVQFAMLPTIDATVRADVNGVLSQSVTVQAGVKQGCCLSPLLFILLLEPLLVAVRADGAIHGIDLGSHTAKASAFADDTTFLILDTGSIPALLAWTARFGMASGLLLNRDKCWLLNLPRDNPELGERAFGIRWLHGEDTEQLLGYTVGHHRLRNHRHSWKTRTNSYLGALTRWNAGLLAYHERALVHTVFAASGLIYLASVSTPTAEEIRDIDNIGRRFLWRGGRVCVKASNCIGKSEGGIGWRLPQYAFAALRARWIPLLATKPDGPWTAGFFEILQHITNTALKTHGRIQVAGGSLTQCLDVLSADAMRSLRARFHPFAVQCFQDWLQAQPASRSPPVPEIKQPSTMISCATHCCARPGDRFVYAHQLKKSPKYQGVGTTAGFWDRPCEIVISIQDRTAVTLETEAGRWAAMRGHDLNHRPEDEPQPVDSVDITASGLYWQRTERRFEPARAVAKWAMYAVSASDDGMSGPRWPRTHMLVANPDWWDLMLLRHLPYQVYNTSYDIAHRCVRTRRWMRIEDDTTCRLCGTDTETVAHVVLHCPALAAKVWPALLPFLAGLGLNRDDSDEGTLLLSLNLPNDSNAVATSLAFFRHVLVTTHLFATNHREGLDRMALAECESALRQYVNREYFLAEGSRQRINFQARWMAQSGRVGAVYPNWDAYQWIPWRHRRDVAQTTPCI